MAAFLFFALQGLSVLEIYTKPPTTLNQQLQLLKDRGLLIDDDELAHFHLRTTNYYRLSAYWYPFRKIEQDSVISDDFEEGTHFRDVIGLYEFDRRLRLQVMDAIERLEVYVRAIFAEMISHKYDVFGHTKAANFHPSFNHGPWLAELNQAIRRANDAFVIHYKNKYYGFPTLPIWMVTEVMSFGNLSRGYRGLKHVDKRIISDKFELHHKQLASWLHTLTYIRNVCSHHGRLWNRNLAIRSQRPMRESNWNFPAPLNNERIFCVLLILRHLLRNVHVSDNWKVQMDDLLQPIAQTEKWRIAMGMPEDWMNHPIWK